MLATLRTLTLILQGDRRFNDVGSKVFSQLLKGYIIGFKAQKQLLMYLEYRIQNIGGKHDPILLTNKLCKTFLQVTELKSFVKDPERTKISRCYCMKMFKSLKQNR